MIRFLTFTLVSLLLVSCHNNVEEELYGTAPCNLDNITFSNQVTTILSNNCYSCHRQKNGPANGSGIILEGYNNVKVYVDNGLLIEAITHGPNASPMPKNGPKLSECNINTIRTWINNGALNN